MAITLTDIAADRVKKFIARRSTETMGLRLAVRISGCSGLAYALEFADKVEADDVEFEDHGVRILVDQKSLMYLDGTRLDYARVGMKEGFKFENPNAKEKCGCGDSFNV
jgi:iron-sulfur cluster assembly protein